MSDEMPCEACKGRGKIPLPVHLQETLDAVRAGKNTTEAVWKKLSTGWGMTAANQRLVSLVRAGLVKRELHGKTWHYTAIIPAARGSKSRVQS